MSKNEAEKQPSTTNQTVSQGGGQQRDQSVDQRLIYQVRKAYEPTERQIQESINNPRKPITEKQTPLEQTPKRILEQKTDNKGQG